MNYRAHVVVLFSLVAIVVSLAGLTGCGKGKEYGVTPVKGKVTAGGQPVKGGVITFRPTAEVAGKGGITGKPASGEVKDDGTFVLSTYGNGDGAVIGKHEVTYMAVAKGAESYEDKPAPSSYAGMVPTVKEVEVKPGPNDIAIEIAKSATPMNPLLPQGKPAK